MKRRLFGVLLALALVLALAPALPVTARADGGLAAPVITGAGLSSDGQPALVWSAVNGASDYAVYRATAENGTYSRIYTTPNNNYTNTSVTSGTTYFYKVCARDSYGWEGAFSAPVSVTVPLGRPTITSAAPNADGKPHLKWDAVSGAAKYVVYRAPNSYGTYKPYYTTTYTSFTNLSAKAGRTYWYKICAVGADGGEGPFSETMSIMATK